MFIGSRMHVVSFLRLVAIGIIFDLIKAEERQWDTQAN
ncbi:hypothetical protein HPHPH9_1119 [Helicobacter pylori Hp H-9]|nr:hypothetical protein HPHPH9_1119 [Helicobacter pylori Hp H-9]